MKKAGFLLVTAATWYLAAMYRSIPLMALTITEVILFLGMWVQSFYFRFRVRAGFGRQLTVCRKGEEPSCSIWIESKGILPVGAVSLRMKAFYPEGSRKIRINLLGGTRRRTSRKVRLSMEKQQCGLFSVRMEKIYVYDYLTLFQRKRKEKEEMQQSVRDADFLPGANMDEIRQLRQKEECDMLFLSLYQWEDELEEAVPDYTEEFCFDGNLRFSRSGRTIWQFTAEYYQKEV